MASTDNNGHSEEANNTPISRYWLIALVAVLLVVIGAYFYGKHVGRVDHVPKAKLDQQIKKSKRELSKQCDELQGYAISPLLKTMADMKEPESFITVDDRLESHPKNTTTLCLRTIAKAGPSIYKYYTKYYKVHEKCIDPYPDQYPREYTMHPRFQLDCRIAGVEAARKILGKEYERMDDKIVKILYIDCVETVLGKEAKLGDPFDDCS